MKFTVFCLKNVFRACARGNDFFILFKAKSEEKHKNMLIYLANLGG